MKTKTKKGNIAIVAIIIVIVAITFGVIGWMFGKNSQTAFVREQQNIQLTAQSKKIDDKINEIKLPTEEKNDSEITPITLETLKTMKGVEGDSDFKQGPFIYLHGEISKIDSWNKLNQVDKLALEQLLQKVPVFKLDYSKNPNNVSDEIYIGPIRDCQQYQDIQAKVKESKLSFPWVLSHGHGDNNDLEKCVDFSIID